LFAFACASVAVAARTAFARAFERPVQPAPRLVVQHPCAGLERDARAEAAADPDASMRIYKARAMRAIYQKISDALAQLNVD
jgi:hypothetical protein